MNVVQRLKRFYQHRFYLPLNLVFGKTPVIIYTMGKVGSTSIYESLPNDIFWVQVHALNPEEWEKARLARTNQDISNVLRQSAQVRKYIIEAGRKAKYITVVREPLSRNIAAFFQNFRHFAGYPPSSRAEDQAEQARIFLEKYTHERPLTFFDTEYKAMLGLDVYQEPFPFEQGYQRLRFPLGDLLILRTESPDKLKEKAIADYLELPEFHLHRANVRDEQKAADAYKAFKQSLVLPQSYIQQMLESKYCEHFYTIEEREVLKDEWMSK